MTKHPEFFTATDLSLLHSVAGKAFDKDSPRHLQTERELKAGVWLKTDHWLKQLVERSKGALEAGIRRNVRQQAGTKKNTAGDTEMRLRYKPFTWGRLYRKGQEDFKIFFTVGVDANPKARQPALVWRLGCQDTGSKPLPDHLIRRFEEFRKTRAPHLIWEEVKLEELASWNWEKLLGGSQRFVEEGLAFYDEAVEYVWQEHVPGVNKLARICWNTNGWQRPSGPVGKSRTGGLYEGEDRAGYGVEEWLFDYSRLVKGYHYAFLQPLNVTSDVHEGKTYNIRLYTRNAETGAHYYVGRIRQAEVLTGAEIKAMTTTYESKGWLTEMTEELRAVGANGELDDSMFQFGPFNLRFRPEDVERPDTEDGLLLIPDFSQWSESHRYVLLDDVAPEIDYRPGWEKKAEEPQIVFSKKVSLEYQERQREITSRSVEVRAVHVKLQEELVTELKGQYPADRVEKEGRVDPFRVYVDVVRQTPDGVYAFYEVKALPSLKACLREALGQLLEYACWPTHLLSAEWVIVSYHSLSSDGETYLQNLRKRFKLPVSYRQVRLK